MGRYLSDINNDSIIPVRADGFVIENLSPPLGFIGVFGTGRFKVFHYSGDFTIPADITQIRVRVVGAGGGSARSPSWGGAGGGYAHGVFNVSPTNIFAVTVGASGTYGGGDGGASSFGALISATGGGGGGSVSTVAPVPGIGIGGDFQASGGSSMFKGGGGAAGSQLGNGGSAGAEFCGGAGVGGNNAYGTGGASAFGSSIDSSGGPDAAGIVVAGGSTYAETLGDVNPMYSMIRFPFDGFTGGGGAANTFTLSGIPDRNMGISHGGPGAGGGSCRTASTGFYWPHYVAGVGGVGGGGGTLAPLIGAANEPMLSGAGAGGIGGGAGGSFGMTSNNTPIGGASGGSGLVIVEW